MIINWLNFIYRKAPRLRNFPIFRSLLLSCIKPLKSLNRLTVDKLGYNSQRASLEHYLNTEYSLPFNLTNRTSLIANTAIIYIENWDATVPELIWYSDSESPTTPVWFTDADNDTNPLWFTDADYFGAWDFKVFVPATLQFNQYELEAKINQYILADRRYVIETY